jgi:hypothetical protein
MEVDLRRTRMEDIRWEEVLSSRRRVTVVMEVHRR